MHNILICFCITSLYLGLLYDSTAANSVESVSNGTSSIVINYTGSKPANGSIVFTKPSGSTWTPPASAYTSGIVVTASTITLNPSWITAVKSSNGVGTYTFTVNGVTYGFIIN